MFKFSSSSLSSMRKKYLIKLLLLNEMLHLEIEKKSIEKE
jgi:hypothetical protein